MYIIIYVETSQIYVYINIPNWITYLNYNYICIHPGNMIR